MKKTAIVWSILLTGILMVISCTSSPKNNTVTIKGEMHGDLKGHDTIYMYTRTSKDTAVIKDGKYTFSFPFKKVELKFFQPDYVSKERTMYRPFGILISGPGEYEVTSDIGKGMYASEVKGPKDAELFREFQKEQDTASLSVNNEMRAIFGNNWYSINADSSNYPQYKATYDSLQLSNFAPLITQLVKNNPDAYASAYVLASAGRNTVFSNQQEKWYDMLSDEVKQSEEAQNFYHYIQGVKKSAIGHVVDKFTLPDPQGNPVDFKQFEGEYVMIDFWASWCVPCRKSFPKFREIYKEYHKQGFEIYSISIDESKKSWLKAVKEENNPWPQSLDTKDIAAKGFAVTAVPTTYLINPNREIIAKQIGFDPDKEGTIEKKLAELFKSDKQKKAPQKEAEKTKKDQKKMKAIPMSGMN